MVERESERGAPVQRSGRSRVRSTEHGVAVKSGAASVAWMRAAGLVESRPPRDLRIRTSPTGRSGPDRRPPHRNNLAPPPRPPRSRGNHRGAPSRRISSLTPGQSRAAKKTSDRSGSAGFGGNMAHESPAQGRTLLQQRNQNASPALSPRATRGQRRGVRREPRQTLPRLRAQIARTYRREASRTGAQHTRHADQQRERVSETAATDQDPRRTSPALKSPPRIPPRFPSENQRGRERKGPRTLRVVLQARQCGIVGGGCAPIVASGLPVHPARYTGGRSRSHPARASR